MISTIITFCAVNFGGNRYPWPHPPAIVSKSRSSSLKTTATVLSCPPSLLKVFLLRFSLKSPHWTLGACGCLQKPQLYRLLRAFFKIISFQTKQFPFIGYHYSFSEEVFLWSRQRSAHCNWNENFQLLIEIWLVSYFWPIFIFWSWWETFPDSSARLIVSFKELFLFTNR